jgi:hypothetical protein
MYDYVYQPDTCFWSVDAPYFFPFKALAPLQSFSFSSLSLSLSLSRSVGYTVRRKTFVIVVVVIFFPFF